MKEVVANDKIKAKNVRILIVGEDTKVMSLSAALQKAYDQNLDLIQISDQDIPVCQIDDLQKFKYDMKRSEKEAQKKRRANTGKIKEIQLSYGIQKNDLIIKQKSVSRFLSEGKHVHIVLTFAGRQVSNPETIAKGKELVMDFISTIPDYVASFVQEIDIQGRKIHCTIK